MHAFGLPRRFLEQGSRAELLADCGLTAPGGHPPDQRPRPRPEGVRGERLAGPAARPAQPAGCAPPVAPVRVGDVLVGGDSPVSVQSMTTTKTADVNATLQQIAELTAAGCQIVRVAVPDTVDADALPQIARRSTIPVIADIHFQPRYVFAAIDAGCAAVRVNPGNIKKFDDKVGEIARAATAAGIPIRIGVNAGSLDKRLLDKYGKATAEALVDRRCGSARCSRSTASATSRSRSSTTTR